MFSIDRISIVTAKKCSVCLIQSLMLQRLHNMRSGDVFPEKYRNLLLDSLSVPPCNKISDPLVQIHKKSVRSIKDSNHKIWIHLQLRMASSNVSIRKRSQLLLQQIRYVWHYFFQHLIVMVCLDVNDMVKWYRSYCVKFRFALHILSTLLMLQLTPWLAIGIR